MKRIAQLLTLLFALAIVGTAHAQWAITNACGVPFNTIAFNDQPLSKGDLVMSFFATQGGVGAPHIGSTCLIMLTNPAESVETSGTAFVAQDTTTGEYLVLPQDPFGIAFGRASLLVKSPSNSDMTGHHFKLLLLLPN